MCQHFVYIAYKGGDIVGMTDKQFASYQLSQLRRLEAIKENLAKANIKDPLLEQMIQDIRDELKRP